ncbi:hypothetical protein BGS_1180 [Beggiatoa sp. SS]|nr:hypothetical protein BGS_1180 [Beggiatoa sp. SS]
MGTKTQKSEMKFDNILYGKHPLAWLLAPLSWLFCAIVQIRRQAYSIGLLTRHLYTRSLLPPVW